MSDLYDTLGVDRSASEDDIKQAFRRLSMTYHPDRRLDPEEKRVAGVHWLDIAAAYDVLSDSKRRMVYDELGGENLESALALLKDDVKTPDDLRRAWRRAEKRGEEQELHARMRLNGSLVFFADASDILQPPEPDMPLVSRLTPHFNSVALNEDMTLALDGRNTLSLTQQIVTKSGLGGSTLRIGFRRQLSSVSSVQLSSALDGTSTLALALSRRISRHSNGCASLNLGPAGLLSLALTATRQLTKRTLGEISISLAAAAESGLTVRLQRFGAKPAGKAADAEGAGPPDPAAEAEAVAEAEAEAEAVASPPALSSLTWRQLVFGAPWWLPRWLGAVPARMRRLAPRAKARLSRSTVETTLQPSGARGGGTLLWRHSPRSRSKLALRLGMAGSSLTLSTERLISRASNSAFGVAFQARLRDRPASAPRPEARPEARAHIPADAPPAPARPPLPSPPATAVCRCRRGGC